MCLRLALLEGLPSISLDAIVLDRCPPDPHDLEVRRVDTLQGLLALVTSFLQMSYCSMPKSVVHSSGERDVLPCLLDWLYEDDSFYAQP